MSAVTKSGSMKMLIALRHFVMRFTHSMILKRKLPEHFGKVPILVSSEGGLKYILRKTKDIEPSLLWLATEFVTQNANAWDIGANLGFFTVAAAARAGTNGNVLAIEPDIWLASLLLKTAALQPETSAKINVIPAAVANEIDIRTFYISSFARATNHLASYGYPISGAHHSSQKVLTLSLDWLAERFPAPQVLKIDVEGAEIEVLQGGLNMIAQNRPIIICEVCSENSQAVLNILKQLNYRIFDAEVTPEARVALAEPTWNTLAIPS